MIETFWALPRGKQETFLKNIYSLSPVTKDIFSIWLADGEENVLQRMLTEIEKNTINKIGKSRKIKVSNLNQLIKNAKAYPMSNMAMIQIYFSIWTNFLEFIHRVKWIASRYQKSCSKFIEIYFDCLQDISEISEREKKKKEMKKIIAEYIENGTYCPDIEIVYTKLFKK